MSFDQNIPTSRCTVHYFIRYTKYYEIPEPSDDVDEVMEHVARKLHAFVKGELYLTLVWLGKNYCAVGHSRWKARLSESDDTFHKEIQIRRTW